MRFALIFALLVSVSSALSAEAADASPPSPAISVSVLTLAPGQLTAELFGHNALRLRGPTVDVLYEWGVYDDTQPYFLWNFATGNSIYAMASVETDRWLGWARADGRQVTEQVLNLSDDQTRALIDRLLKTDTPANRTYPYDPLIDNCSTRLRDALDAPGVLDGAIRHAGQETTGQTWRWHARRFGGESTWFDVLALQYAFGVPTDRTINQYEAAFLPLELARLLEAVTLPDGTPLVGNTQVLVDVPSLPVRQRPADSKMLMLALAAPLGFIVVAFKRKGWVVGVLGTAWYLFAGAMAVVMLFFQFFSTHWYSQWNMNLLLLSPLCLPLVVLLPLGLAGVGWAERGARIMAATALVLAVVGVLANVVVGQENGAAVLLALPMHFALVMALEWRYRQSRHIMQTAAMPEPALAS